MQYMTLSFRTLGAIALPALLVAMAPQIARAEAPKLNFGGAGWFSYNTIVKSSDTANAKEPNGKYLIGSGALFAINVDPSERLHIEAGIGVGMGHFLATSPTDQGGYAPVGAGPFVSNANFTFKPMSSEGGEFFVRGGLFPYDYMPEAQNLGLYLLRGPVYPGYLLSGFETKHVMPVANTLGLQLHHRTGGFSHDFLFTFETDFYPYWDMSPAYLASYSFGETFRLGGGVNFYHLIPADSRLTTDTLHKYIDNTLPVPDTTQLSFKGIKVMANASLDPKPLFGNPEILGPEDLKLYGEVAVIGLDNDKAHKALYGNYSNRMPIMVGFNLPAFGFLERLAVEVEHYGAKFKDDISQYNRYRSQSPKPASKIDTNYAADNLKWSVYGSRVFQQHVKLSFQVASDHYRPGQFRGYGDNLAELRPAIFFRPSEWYWSTKVAYFF